MIKLEEIIGQPVALKTLQSAIATGEMAHAYLFIGPEGVGKKTAAFAFARGLLCLDRIGPDACGVCSACRRIEHNTYPDLVHYRPTVHKGKVKKEINIDDMREIIPRVNMKPYESERKVVLLEGVDAMNVPAANAFLKTLEEPPPQTILLLIASNVGKLLPTIISRCQTVRFGPVPYDVMVPFLMKREGMNEAEAQEMAALSGGAPGAALSDSCDERREIRAEALNLLATIDEAPGSALFRLASRMDRAKDKAITEKTLQSMRTLLRDLMVVKSSPKCDTLINRDLQLELQRIAASFSGRRLLRAFELTEEMIFARTWNINPLLVMSSLMLELRR